VLFQTAGIVVLTLVINGTTTKMLLDVLKLTAVTQGRLDEMDIVVKHILDQQQKALVILRHDKFQQGANWDFIYRFTQIQNPYKSVNYISFRLVLFKSILYANSYCLRRLESSEELNCKKSPPYSPLTQFPKESSPDVPNVPRRC